MFNSTSSKTIYGNSSYQNKLSTEDFKTRDKFTLYIFENCMKINVHGIDLFSKNN